jgi:hypothetical protein
MRQKPFFTLSLCASVPLCLLLAGSVFGQNPIHVTYLWHMHQPVYYPYESVGATDGAGRYNFSVAGVHNERTGPYTSWPKNAVQQGADRGLPHAGVQVSFSGSLGENLNGLWGSGWPGDYRWARNNLRTSLNNPRLDTVGIAYHHSLMPLTSYESMRMQIKLHKEIYKELWDTQGYSKGFWPPECAFAENMIPALVDEGLEWVLVDNGHFDRACQNYPWVNATSIRPNPSDQINPDPATLGSQWVQLNNVWAPSKVSAPWGYQPHKVKYVNPVTGGEQKMTAVPAARYEGNENGRGGYGAFKPENVWGTHVNNGVNNNAQRPMLIVCHSDGDNYGMLNADAYNGQHGNFLTMVQNDARFDHSSVQDYLDMYPVPDNDVIHVEPGSWIGIDGGTPYFDKWVENNPGFRGDPNEHPDLWSWSMIVAAQNRVIHADRLEGGYSMNDVQWGIGSDTAKAWHFYLQAETSCHWYWDYDRANPWDGNTTRGCNLAVAEANKVINRHPGSDPMGPSIFPPQRTIWNPGGKHWNETTNQPTTFQVWSFIHDASAIREARLFVRKDNDGLNPISENDNEVFAQNVAKVEAWTQIAMSSNWYPAGKGPMVPDPAARAMRYQGTVSGYNNALLDYFIEAVDTAGNTNRSEIKHVWVGESGVVNPVTFQPSLPDNCPGSTLRIAYNSAGRNLSAANPVTASVRYVGAASSNDLVMSGTAGGLWSVTSAIPAGASSAVVTFKSGGTTDDNSGATWTIGIATCAVPAAVSFNPPAPNGCVPVTITYTPNDGPLKNAAQVRIHVGFNGWQGVLTPDPVMTAAGPSWTYTYTPPAGAYEINCVFNDGGSTWENNNGQDYKVAVSNCSPEIVAVTFSPGVPRQCDPLVITYNPEDGPLAAVNPVYVVQYINGNFGAPQQNLMAAQGALWVFTNVNLTGVTNLAVRFGNAADTLQDDNGGARWSVAVSSCNTNGPSTVTWEPVAPHGCVPVTLSYRPNNGPLATSAAVRVHIGFNGWQGAASVAMSPQGDGSWVYVYNSPEGASQINVCFNDGGSTWDNNATQDWLINVTGCGAPVGLRFASGSPIISQGLSNQQNRVSETFLFSQSGGYASTSNQGGFGSFGRVFVNYDANNFYIGAYDVDMVGSNNAMMIFLEVNTLGDNAGNLWSKTGLPQGLDFLHNVTFAQNADLALVLGDEWGDGQFPSFSLGNGYDMGQGAWYLSATSFWPVAGFKLSQFDGAGAASTASADDDGNRLTDRWQASIPWESLGSTNGISGITNMWLYGLIVSDGTNGVDRYISGNYLARTASPAVTGNYGFASVALSGIPVGLPSLDENSNGIPDAWEMEHFGSLGVMNDTSDWDLDGQPDRAEYWSGTHPKNAQSHLRATQVMQAPGAGGFVVRWFSVSNKVYDLHRSTDLMSGAFVPVQTNLSATPSENSYTDTTVNADAVIYRVISR